jgi:stage V sporulation protein D (sporulation-specific penicillin-binding protein)
MESVVTDGTAGNAKVAGYRIGGKTGTSEKIDEYDENGELVEDKIVSFIGVAPINDPQYICLIALDTPNPATGYYISGGIMAAPTCRDVFADILPYLGVEADYDDDDISQIDVTVPNVVGKTEEEAATAISDKSLTYRTVGYGDTVTAQIPAANAKIPGNSTIVLYMGEEAPDDMITVPNVIGQTVSQANATIINSGTLYMKGKGSTASSSSVATNQDPAAGTSVARGTVITVEFTDMSAQD